MPRLINRICDRALHLAYLKRSGVIDGLVLQEALDYVRQPDTAPGLAATTETSTTIPTPVPPPPELGAGKAAAASW